MYGKDKNIDFELKVSTHPGGNKTLMQSKNGGHFTDCRGRMFANPDEATFYRAVACYLGELLEGGHKVRFTDS